MPGSPDPTRPSYHLCPPVGWMNDPNGTVFYQGYYHVFYQWNPYSDQWGTIHWGHARSRDLITWEHLPAALTPSPELGEAHCFSGCLALRAEHPPLILYTAIGPEMDVRYSAQQWAAVGDEELIRWQKHARNPILVAEIHGGMEVLEWRDPFVFAAQGRTFLLLGGKLTEKDGNGAVVLLYEAQSAALEQWTYRGVLFQHPDLARVSVECANFFPCGPRWVLLLSTHKLVEYFVGAFDADAGIFTPHATGLLDGSDQFYATNILLDDHQRHICFGWIRGFAAGKGWNGCLSLPRVLTVDPEGYLRQTPAPEAAGLHGPGMHLSDVSLGVHALEGWQSDAMDLHALIKGNAQTSFGVRLIPVHEPEQPILLVCTPHETRLNDKRIPYSLQPETVTDIRLFLDRAVVEAFIDNAVCLTLALPHPASAYHVELFAENGQATLRQLDVWPMLPPVL